MLDENPKIDYFVTIIHKELVDLFDNVTIPYGKGIYIKKDDEHTPVYCTYLPYEDNTDLYFDDELISINEYVKVTIIADITTNYTAAEIELRNLFEKYGYAYENSDLDISDSEPYTYLRTLYFNKTFYFEKGS